MYCYHGWRMDPIDQRGLSIPLNKDITTPELKEAWQQGRKELFYPYGGRTHVQTPGEQD